MLLDRSSREFTSRTRRRVQADRFIFNLEMENETADRLLDGIIRQSRLC